MIASGASGSFGEWLKRRREAMGFTQKELAYAAGCSVSTLRKVESGERRPSRQVAELLATCLEIAPEERQAFMQLARAVHVENADSSRQGAVPNIDIPTVTGYPDLPPLPTTAPPTKTPPPQALQTADRSFAPLPTSTSRPPTNLHAPLTSFVGRKAELAMARSLIWRVDIRLLTLTGPPGIGKTRLASELAASLLTDFADGVFMVPLASTTDPALVMPTVARVLRVSESAGRSLEESVAEYLRDKVMLLVLDNFEQVTEAAPQITDLLQATPGLKIVATSRTPLHIYGEQQFPVPALAVPSAGYQDPQSKVANKEGSETSQRWEDYDAVQLFVRRAHAVQPGFALSAGNVEIVTEICRRLDGLPLAIELAAARVQHMDPGAILTWLEQSGQLRTLIGGPNDRSPRQRTMYDAVAWSYNLLSNKEQAVFRKLSVFAGGFTPEAVEAVCSAAEMPGGAVVMDVLLSLADKSLVKQERARVGNRTDARFAMLQVMKEYGLEQLRTAGEEQDLRRRHGLYYLDFAERAASQLRGLEQLVWFERIELERDNLRQAWQWLFSDEATEAEWPEQSTRWEIALRVSSLLVRFWAVMGSFMEGREWVEAALKLAEDAQRDGKLSESPGANSLIANALDAAGRLAWSLGDYAAASSYYSRGLALYRAEDNKQGIAGLLNSLATVPFDRGDYETAREMYEEALALAREAADKWLVARSLNNLGNLYRNTADYVSARACYEESATLFREAGDISNGVTPLTNLSLVCMDQEDYFAARRYQEEAVAISREIGHKGNLMFALAMSGARAVEEREFQQAREIYRENLPLIKQMNHLFVFPMSLEGIASMYALQGLPLAAARLWGAAEATRQSLNLPMPLPGRARYERRRSAARKEAGEERFEEAWKEGTSMSGIEAINYALELLDY